MSVIITVLGVGKYVLITGGTYTVDMRTVSRKCFLYSVEAVGPDGSDQAGWALARPNEKCLRRA